MTDVLLPDALSASSSCVTLDGFSTRVTLAPDALEQSAYGTPSPGSSSMILDPHYFLLDTSTAPNTRSPSLGRFLSPR